MAAVVVDQASETPNDPSSPTVPLEGEALEKALLQQFEFYFSQENLDKDTYLQSQMNAQNYVPVDVIMNFRKVVSLTTDKDLVVKVMSECKNLVLDENQTMVRPNKRGRITLILRDIPDSVPEDDIKSIFQIPGCPAPVKVRSDIGDTWFVQFNTEAECQDAMLAVMGTTFQGKPLRCGVKSEHVVRAYAPINRVSPSSMGSAYSQEFAPGYQPFNPYLVGPYNHWQQQPNPYGDPNFDPNSRKGRTNQPRTGKPKEKPFGAKTKRKGKEGETPRKGEVQELKLGLDNFPALPTPAKQQHKVLKYDREIMAAIAKHVSATPYPCPMPAGDNSAVLSSKPLTESQLLEPMPVIYPASPSPLLAAQPHHSSQLPVLDLNLPFLEYAEMPDSIPETSEETPTDEKEASPVTVHVPKARGSKSRRKSEADDSKAVSPPAKEEKKSEKPTPTAAKSPQTKASVKGGASSPSKQTYADLLKKKSDSR